MPARDKPPKTQSFFFETSKRRAREKATGSVGHLISATQIQIKGDHTQGPVGVDVCYIARFQLDSPRQDSQGNQIKQVEETFDRVVPRDEWRNESFEIIKKKRRWWFF